MHTHQSRYNPGRKWGACPRRRERPNRPQFSGPTDPVARRTPEWGLRSRNTDSSLTISRDSEPPTGVLSSSAQCTGSPRQSETSDGTPCTEPPGKDPVPCRSGREHGAASWHKTMGRHDCRRSSNAFLPSRE